MAPRPPRLALPALLLLLCSANEEASPLIDTLAQDDECGADVEGCSLHAIQRRARHRTAVAVSGALPEPLAAPMVPSLAPALLESKGGAPSSCYWQPWTCGPDDWGWTTPPPSSQGRNNANGWASWNAPWTSWTPAPHPADLPTDQTGLCKAMPWMCPAPTPAPPRRPPAPALPPSPPPVSLEVASKAPLLTFYIYRVQNDDNYPQPNHDMLNIAGGLWYLQNEVVWHATGRAGTYFSHPVTRMIKFKIQTRATQPLWDMGMNFGVFNAFDSGQCTGPFECDNYPKVGFAVGCETWEAGAGSNFPHAQWNELNHYKGAIWYSLPGECPSQPFPKKTEQCKKEQPGGMCPPGVTPTGTFNCTYQLQEIGQLTIDEIVGTLPNYNAWVAAGGREYDPTTDKGVKTSFWDGLKDDAKCAARVQHVEDLFRQKYPNQPPLQSPPCDFNKVKFYPDKVGQI